MATAGWVRLRRIAVALLIVALIVAGAMIDAAHAQIPSAAQQYERTLTRHAYATFGPNAPVARLAAQIHQESHWRPDVCSWASACGLAQFIPSTATWMAEIYPRQLEPADPGNPAWALQAQVLYDQWLLRQVALADECQAWAMTLAAYNGGIGWLNRDRSLAEQAGADRGQWFGSVERYTRRADWARDENRAYVRRILLDLEARYLTAGWPGQSAACVSTSRCSRD